MAINPKYIAYNILRTDYKKLFNYIEKLRIERKQSKIQIFYDLGLSLFKSNTRFLDYFYFNFFDAQVDKKSHTNVWDMHLFHKKYNSKNSIVFRDKIRFRKRFAEYFNYPFFVVESESEIQSLINWISTLKLEKLVAKDPMVTMGNGVLILDVDTSMDKVTINGQSAKEYFSQIFRKGFTLFETFIEQHNVLARIYPKSINTIRIVTFLNDQGSVEIWGALLRMGLDKSVDNFDAGGLSANIDLETGRVISPAIVKDPFNRNLYYNHPENDKEIYGVIIPFWNDIILLIKKAAMEVKDVRTVGWDVAISSHGPTLIEGNDNWDKTHFELASGIGLNSRIKLLLK